MTFGLLRRVLHVATLLVAAFSTLRAQDAAAGRTRPPVRMDSLRAAQLYVSSRPEDHPQRNHTADMLAKAQTDSIYGARSRGVMDFQKISYKSSVDGMT